MSKIQKYTLGIIAGVIVLGIFSLSSGLINPSWNPFKQPPGGEVLETAIYNLSKLEKMRVLAVVNLAIESPKKITGVLNLNQIVDYSNKTQKKNSTNFDLSVGVEGLELSVDSSMIGIDKTLYLKINELPPYLPLGIDVETLKNQWLLVDPARIGYASSVAGGPAQLNLFGGIASTSDEVKKSQDTEFLNELKALVIGQKIFKLKRNLGKETIDGQTSSHYSAEVDKQTAKELLPKIFALASPYQQELQKSLSELEQNFDEIWKALGGLNFEVWIDDSSQTLRKIKFAKEIQQSKLGIEISFMEFGKDFVIEAPTEFKPIQDVLPPDLLGIATSASSGQATTTASK